LIRLWRFLLVILFGTVISSAWPDEVKVYEEPLTIPTYRLGEPELMPRWSDRIYPYTMLDKITQEKYDRTYRALWVENEYVKALVLPEIGGRLHGAQDKTNGYQYLYNQVTIKPGLVGLTGAWISGGVEWNFPDGHRASGFRDTDYRIVGNPDGSKTVWTGEIDRVSKMRWSVGTTVHPGRSWVETKVRLYNCTPYVHRFQFWATSAVRATNEYQAVIPGEIVTGHGKHQFYHWPVNNGINLSYWKNIVPASSFFAWESQSDYFGGYSPEEKAGMVHVADHYIVRGKKLWTWGTAPSGRIWEEILTDGDLPYFEPQAGGYSDNQPDLHWIMPGETKVFSHFWIPVRDIGVYDYANLEGALNIELEKGKAKFGWSPTGVNKGAQVILTADGEEIFRQAVDADPATPFVAEVKAPKGADLYSLRMTVLSADRDTLLCYQHPKPANLSLPEPESPFPAPEKAGSTDELFLIGDHYDRFYNPDRAMDYYSEALRRDPGDVRSNTARGLQLVKQGRYEEALKHFDKALERSASFYKAWYFKGLAELGIGKAAEAEKSLNRASYELTYYGAAHFELAQLAASQGRWERALEHIGRSIRGNGDNSQAYAVKALILNRLGRHQEALEVALGVQADDPLDYLSLAERAMALSKLERRSELEAVIDTVLSVTRRDSENHLELAIRYARCGLYDEACLVLKALTDRSGAENFSPMVYYYLAYYSDLLGKSAAAEDYRATAAGISPRYCFPSRLESFPVLGWAVKKNPRDARAQYLLGNLYYNKERADEAIACWEKAVALEPSNVVANRNRGYAWAQKNDLQQARKAYEAAVNTEPSAALAVYELEGVYEDLGLPVQERVAFLEQHPEALSKSDPVLKRLISGYVQLSRFQDALKWLSEHHFKSWEGRYDIHQYWVESHIQQGDLDFNAGNYEKALEHYRLALTYPPNLEVAEQPRTTNARKLYKVGLALEALKKKGEAKKMFNQVVSEQMRPDNASQYFRGKALEKLGKKDQARKVYEELLAAVKRLGVSENEFIEDEMNFDPRRKPQALLHFKLYLALEGLGRLEEAETERKEALKRDPIVALRAFSPPRAGW